MSQRLAIDLHHPGANFPGQGFALAFSQSLLSLAIEAVSVEEHKFECPDVKAESHSLAQGEQVFGQRDVASWPAVQKA